MSGILVVAEQRRGELMNASLECIGAANQLSPLGSISVVVIAPDAASYVSALSLEGVDEIITINPPETEYQADSMVAALAGLIAERQPSLVLTPHSIDAWSYAPTLATQLNCGFTSDVFGLRIEEGVLVATRAAYAEKLHMELDFPNFDTVLITLRGNSFKVPEAISSPSVSSFDMPSTSARSSHLSYIEAESGGDVDITQATCMLSIGRGVGEEDNIEQFAELAESMDFTLGCSRPIADNGWLPKYRQVGQSGKTVANCSVYLALGISGSVQHMAGMKHVPNIIAVNTDPEASMFSIARYGVVADMFDIAEELENHF